MEALPGHRTGNDMIDLRYSSRKHFKINAIIQGNERTGGRQPQLPAWCTPAPEKDEPAYGDRRVRTRWSIEDAPFGLRLCDDHICRGEKKTATRKFYHPNNELDLGEKLVILGLLTL
jgi:hypothetical protein